jgi:para-nitrobenzyl esterase
MPDGEADGLFCVADTSSGKVRGLINAGIRQFKGVPYGASTGGRRRFLPPAVPSLWTGVRDCLGYCPVSPQVPTDAGNVYGQLIHFDLAVAEGGIGEDCLHLNIWTPAFNDGGKRAVLFSIHGGGFAISSGNAAIYDGAQLAALGDVVVVTVTHRLASFGYLNLVDAGAPDDFALAGVAGIADLVLALEWVRDNIANFGGDPGRVMIFGQSGGGWKTSVLLAAPAAKGLFHRAAIQSGSLLRLQTREESVRTADALLKGLGLSKDNIADIQTLPWQTLLAAQTKIGAHAFAPVLDGHYLPHHPFDPSAPNESADIPLIISTTLDDAGLFFANFDLDEAGLAATLRGFYGDAADAILKLYRAHWPRKSPYLLQAQIITDAGFRRFAYIQAERKAAQKAAPVYMYQWDWPSPGFEGQFGAVHGIDISASFHNMRDPILGSGALQGRKLSDQLADVWIAFAKTGKPENEKTPSWPAFTSEKREVMVFGNETQIIANPQSDIRAFWDSRPIPATVLG